MQINIKLNTRFCIHVDNYQNFNSIPKKECAELFVLKFYNGDELTPGSQKNPI